jgi:phenylalanyl-tRNA synthetase beta chain
MNSLVSYNWLSEYVDLKGITPEEFAQKMSLSGPGVEKLHVQGDELNGIVVGRIVELKAHPNADKLRIAMVNIGNALKPSTIVCGGSNLAVHQWVAVATVGSRVRWHGEGELVTLEPATIRGVESEGMICASNEIGLGDAYPAAERVILDVGAAFPDAKLLAGASFASLLGISTDVVMDIEVTTNRVDAMGMVGMAREASAILGRKMLWKEIRNSKKIRNSKEGVTVKVHEPKLCPRYMAARITGVKNGTSPWWMKRRLASAGMDSISLLVDITNYVLLELAQPMHVFDVARLRHGAKGPEIHVRRGRDGETMKALDGKDYALDDQSLVIADAEGPVAVAGVMGGERSGAYEDTTDIIFEAATFDPVSVRRTARRLNLYSDSQLRYEKGLSTEALPIALSRAIELTLELAGGALAGPIVDVAAGRFKAETFSISSDVVDERIGAAIPQSRQVSILKSLGFAVKTSGKIMKATVPWWREHDIESSQDLVEEIARVYGYGNVPALLPVGESAAHRASLETLWEDRVKTVAHGAGLTEVYSYSFVSDEMYRKAGYDPSICLHLQNPLTEEFSFMRTTLLPSLLQIVAENQERYKTQRLFEVAHAYYPTSQGWSELPDERLELGCAFLVGENGWREAKGFVEHLLHELGVHGVEWRRLSEGGFWHPGRSAQAFSNGKLLATIGEVSPSIVANFKIEGRVAMIDCPLEEVFACASTTKSYTPPRAFPEVKRDLAVVVDARVEYTTLASALRESDPLLTHVEWFDTYQGKGLADGKKSVAMHLTFASDERTLTGEEVDGAMQRVVASLMASFGAEVR